MPRRAAAPAPRRRQPDAAIGPDTSQSRRQGDQSGQTAHRRSRRPREGNDPRNDHARRRQLLHPGVGARRAGILAAGLRRTGGRRKQPHAHRRHPRRVSQRHRRSRHRNRLRRTGPQRHHRNAEQREDGGSGESPGHELRSGSPGTPGRSFGLVVRRTARSRNGHRHPRRQFAHPKQRTALRHRRIPDRGLLERRHQLGGHRLDHGAERRLGDGHLRSPRRQRRHHHRDEKGCGGQARHHLLGNLRIPDRDQEDGHDGRLRFRHVPDRAPAVER